MKRIILALIALLWFGIMLLPISVHAEIYDLSNTDVSIQLDDEYWYVFTRDNIKNNPYLADVGGSYDEFNQLFLNNNVYMAATVYYDDGESLELFIRKTPSSSSIKNLSDQSYEEAMEIVHTMEKELNLETCSLYINKYKFVRSEYTREEEYIFDFLTIVNNECYTFRFCSTTPLDNIVEEEMITIVDSIYFDIDSNGIDYKKIIVKGIVGAIGGAAVSAFTICFFRWRQKRNRRLSYSVGLESFPDVMARYKRGIETVEGRLYFDETGMTFESHGFNIQIGETRIEYAQIQSIQKRKGVILKKISVFTQDGFEHKFAVSNRDEVVAFLESKKPL